MSMIKKLSLASCLYMAATPACVLAAKLPEGTDVRLQLTEKVSSATATEGQRFNLILDEDVQIGGVVLAHRGAKAVGTVISSHKRGRIGKAGELNVQINYLLVGEQRVPLRASRGKEGEGRVGTTVTLTVLFGPLGLLKRGKDVELNPGIVINAQVDQTTELPEAVTYQSYPQQIATPSSTVEPVRTEVARTRNGRFTGNQTRVSASDAAGPVKWLCEFAIQSQTFWKEAYGNCPQEMPAP